MNKHYTITTNQPQLKMIIELNAFISNGVATSYNADMHEYHMSHINLVKKYAQYINNKLGNPVSDDKLEFIALSHDLFKEKFLNPEKHGEIKYSDHIIPQDLNRYVRTNLDILEKFGLDDYFNTSIQYHPLSSGIFLYKELGITDESILYPVMFHSCPIIPVYKTLYQEIRTMTDIIMLSDKLSSSQLGITLSRRKVNLDMDRIVFGDTGKEFNYGMGLYLAKLVGHGKSDEQYGLESVKYYYDRLHETNPLIPEMKLEEKKKWPVRESPLWNK